MVLVWIKICIKQFQYRVVVEILIKLMKTMTGVRCAHIIDRLIEIQGALLIQGMTVIRRAQQMNKQLAAGMYI